MKPLRPRSSTNANAPRRPPALGFGLPRSRPEVRPATSNSPPMISQRSPTLSVRRRFTFQSSETYVAVDLHRCPVVTSTTLRLVLEAAPSRKLANALPVCVVKPGCAVVFGENANVPDVEKLLLL